MSAVSDTPPPKPLDEVAERAQALHQEAYRRCVAAPDGLGGRI
jgi:hypothetical protein